MVILLAFANDTDAHLALLKAESRAIYESLRPLEKREFLKIEREESTTTDELATMLLDNLDKVVIFHYAGHAGSTALRLEDREGQAKGLAKLLGEQKNLKLVFLNGCSTRGQVAELFAAGVKGVIATTVPIKDAKAKDFAAAFYEALASKRTIRRAFEVAKGILELKYRDTPSIEISRGIGKSGQNTEGVQNTWQLHIKDGYEDEVGDYRLPSYKKIELPMLSDIATAMPTNKYLIYVLSEMCHYHNGIYHDMLEMRNNEQIKKDSSTYLDLVIQYFPFVIGSQIQLLRQKTTPDMERLQQIISTYIITGQTLYFILLSDLWAQKDKQKFKTPPYFLQNHHITPETLGSFDFWGKLADLYAAFPEKDNLFVPEFRQLVEALSNETRAQKAKNFLEILRGGFRNTAADSLATTCLKAEQALTLMLKEAAFLAAYQMLTVRNIEIDNPRSRKESYELQMARLNAIVHTSLSFFNDTEYRRKVHYTNCDSVVLVSGNDLLNAENALSYYLNLSPFIIDKNTFLGQPHIDLFLFAYEKPFADGQQQENETYFYYNIRHSFFTALTNEKGMDIVHTAMTRADFKEGKNDLSKTDKPDDDFGFAEAFGQEAVKTMVDDSPVFADLENQFEQFKTEFNHQ